MKTYLSILLLFIISFVAKAQEQIPAEADKLFKEGMELKGKGSYAEAVSKFTAAIAVYPWMFDYWYQRGFVRIDMEQYHEAIADFSYMLCFDPTHLRAHMERAYALKQIGQLKAASLDYKAAVDSHPQDYKANYELGYVLIDLEDYTNAITYLKKATEISPTNADPFYELGYAYKMTNQYDKAIEVFLQSMQKTSGSVPDNMYFSLGDCYLKIGKKEEACKHFAKAKELGVEGMDDVIATNCK